MGEESEGTYQLAVFVCVVGMGQSDGCRANDVWSGFLFQTRMGLKKCELFFNVNPKPVEKMLVHSNLLLVSCSKRSQATLGLTCAAGLVRKGVALYGRRMCSLPVEIWACKVSKCTGRYSIGCKHAHRIWCVHMPWFMPSLRISFIVSRGHSEKALRFARSSPQQTGQQHP